MSSLEGTLTDQVVDAALIKNKRASFIRIDYQTIECTACNHRFYEKQVRIENPNSKIRALGKGKLAIFCPKCLSIVGFIEMTPLIKLFTVM